jgi:YQGE family putative transporter
MSHFHDPAAGLRAGERGKVGRMALRYRDEKPASSKTKARFDRQAWLLLVVNGFFAVANALSGTFVNVYMWKTKNDFALIGWFAFTAQLAGGLTFWLAGKWVKEHNKMNSLRLGVAVSALFYLLVLILQQRAVHYVILLGAVQGIAFGLFWLAFNVVYFEVTGPDNRDRFNGWAGLLGSLSGMVAPWVSGLLITRLGDTNGYRFVFAMSLGVFVAGAVFSFFLKKRKVPGIYDWLHGFKVIASDGNPWRRVSLALVAQGIREGVFGFMIALLVYVATRNEWNVGNFSLLTSAVALVSYWLIGRLLKPAYRKWGMLVGAVMIVLVIVPFFWRINYATLLVFGVGVALFMPLYSIPMTSSVFDLIGKDERSAKLRVEYVVFRELALTAGRMIGTLLFIAVVSRTTAPHAVSWLLLGIGSSPIAAWLLMKNRLAGVKWTESR